MCLEAQDAQLHDIVSLMITGCVGRFEGKVIGFDDKGYPFIQVEKTGPYSKLEWGDYVLLERLARGY